MSSGGRRATTRSSASELNWIAPRRWRSNRIMRSCDPASRERGPFVRRSAAVKQRRVSGSLIGGTCQDRPGSNAQWTTRVHFAGHSRYSLAVMSGGTRIIEYEVVPWTDLDRMGDLVTLLNKFIKIGSSVGILRAITEDEERVTFVGNAEAMTKMVSSGAASNPAGIAIPMDEIPVILTGWPYRLRDK